ncbi:MAG: DoxX family protein [Candidatus Nomurabacteria bacterium]|nr:DoxX family protein [Candidatus Nomurabacteria bacterium]
MTYIYILGKLLFGGYFLKGGYGHFKNADMLAGYAKSKGVPSAKIAVLVSGGVMILGGLGVIFGPYTQLATLLLLVFMLPVTLMMHAYWKITDPAQRMGDEINFYKNVAIIGALLMLFCLTSLL